jgi:ubiquinone/menaquinone biosynthesis C-methylase UbiE
MTGLTPMRRLLKLIHPEGIPWPGTLAYNLVSQTRIFQHYYDLMAEDIISYCSEGNILDIGTGPGRLMIKIHQKSPALRLTGLDTSSSMVAKAWENLAAAGLSEVIDVREGNVDSMPFADESFDAVVSTGSIHHWKQPTTGLNEVFRVLKCGGYALMYDLVSDTPKSILREATREFGRFRMTLLWVHSFEEPFYSCNAFESLAGPTRFKEGRIRFVGGMCCLTLQKDSPSNPA